MLYRKNELQRSRPQGIKPFVSSLVWSCPCRYVRNLTAKTLVLCALVIALSTGNCGFIDLRPIGYSAFPGSPDAVLPAKNTPVGIRFDTEMDQLETQKAFSVNCNGAVVKGDLSWNNNELSFVPLEDWQAGLRYTLVFDGTIFARDGRDMRAFLFIPFYAPGRETLPYLESYSPADGASTGVNSGEGAVLVLRFSLPMERYSTEDAVAIDGISEKEFRWSDEDRVLEVFFKKNLLPWTVYRWTLNAKAFSKDGAPLAKEAGASFTTDADRMLPELVEVFPLIKSDPDTGLWWQRTGLPLENGLGPGQAIGILFNKPMNESVQRSIRFEPALPGRYESRTAAFIVFIPDKDPEPEIVYTLIVSSDAKDLSGLKMEKDYTFYFTPDIPYLKLLSLRSGNEHFNLPENGASYRASVSMPDGKLALVLRFSHTFTVKAQADAIQALRLEVYFPMVLPQISLRTARWLLDDTLFIEWEKIKPGKDDEAHYYRLVLPGKRGGITDGKGSYLKEDCVFILEA